MEELEEKAVVQIDADGAVKKCAKNAGADCGYKAGAKVCGKCGAMAVQVKKAEDLMEDDEDELTDDEKALVRQIREMDDDEFDKSFPDDETKWAFDVAGAYARRAVTNRRKKRRRKEMGEDPMEAMDEKEMDEEAKPAQSEMGEEPMEAMNEDDRATRMRARKRRMASMQVKSEEWGDDAYLCGFEGKMLAGAMEPCAACPGGCAPESDLPTLIEVEGLAEEMLVGKVLDSGYSDAADLFIVNVELKDGSVAEAIYDGSTAKCLGWQLLDEELIGEKSAEGDSFEIISIEDAIGIATKNLPGEVVSVDAELYEGYDAYAIEIDGVDGKSHDAFISLDGEFLGSDSYDAEEASDIDAETAEFELKAMYSEEQRTSMAEEGMALEDGSFPIKNVDDLKNAIMAYGRAKDKAKAKAHIMKRAEELDAADMIPESWTEKDDEDEVEIKADDAEFLATLMEFEMLAIEDDTDGLV